MKIAKVNWKFWMEDDDITEEDMQMVQDYLVDMLEDQGIYMSGMLEINDGEIPE